MAMHLHYNRLDAYILGKYIKTFILWLVLIIVIVITFDVSEKLDDFLHNHAPANEIVFKYYLNFIPNFFNLYGPLFVFISTLYFTSKMASHTEIIAIFGGGISYRRMLRPYFHGALLLAIGILVVGNFVIPRSNVHLKQFESEYIHTKKRNFYSDLHFQTSKGVQVSTYTYDVNERSAQMFMQDTYNDEGKMCERIYCDKIIYDTSDGSWLGSNVTHRTFNGESEQLRWHKTARLRLHLEPSDFNEAAKQISTMNSIELYRHIQHEKMRGSGALIAAQLEFYQRLLNPLAFFVMTFIGVAISSRKTRGGIGFHLAIGITLAFGFIILMRMCSVFAINGSLNPFLAVLTPQLVFGIAALILIKKAPK